MQRKSTKQKQREQAVIRSLCRKYVTEHFAKVLKQFRRTAEEVVSAEMAAEAIADGD